MKPVTYILSIIQLIHERWKFKRLLTNNIYLESGVYDIYSPGRTYLVKKEVPNGFCVMIGLNNRKHRISSLRVSECKDKQFQGQLLMITASGYRVFNYKDGTLLTPFKSDEEKKTYYQAVKAL